jgi:putative heme-binding domain-containing protein
MNPDGTDLNVVGFNFRNSYEETVTSFGDVFNNDNDEPPCCRSTYLMEYGNLGYNSNDGRRNWGSDRRPGQSSPIAHWRQENPGIIPAGDLYGGGAPTGIAYYENGALPKKYKGMVLSCEAARNIIFGYLPKPIGAGFTMKNFNFLTSNLKEKFSGNDFAYGGIGQRIKTMFRPSDVAIGVDGAVYVCDWFDARVGGHGTQDRELGGTIYRIAPKGFKTKTPTFDLSSIKGQVNVLKSPAVNVRALGFYALVKSGPKAIPAVKQLLTHSDPHFRARAVWVLSKLGAEGVKVVEGVLKHKDAQMRVVAYRALRRLGTNTAAYAIQMAGDKSAAVRRDVALSLRDHSEEDSLQALLKIGRAYKGNDAWELEAFGTGAFGKEEKLFDTLAGDHQERAIEWDQGFADIAWRLHTRWSLNPLRIRALTGKLSMKERHRALTAIAFINSKEAAQTMMDIFTSGPADIKDMARFWLFHPEHEDWRSFPVIEAMTKAKPVTQNFLVPELLGVETKLPTVKEVLALKGDAKKGMASAAKCYMCHKIGKFGANFGPDLSAYGSMQTRDVIIKAILDPNADIAHGFEGSEIIMKNGKRVQGLIPYQGKNSIIVNTFGGVQLTIAKKEIKSTKKLKKSMMIPASKMGLTAQEVRNITEYLKTLK